MVELTGCVTWDVNSVIPSWNHGPGAGLRTPRPPEVTSPLHILRHLHVTTFNIVAPYVTLVSFKFIQIKKGTVNESQWKVECSSDDAFGWFTPTPEDTGAQTSCRSSHYICCWYPTLGVSKSVQRDCKINVDLRSEEVILTGLWLLEESWVGQLIGTVEPAIKSLILTHKNNKSTVYICVHTIQECKAVHNAVILEHMMRHLEP